MSDAAPSAGMSSTIRIDRVTTRGGDTGRTSLGDGSRVDKTDPRLDAMGDVDEANAAIGALVAVLPDDRFAPLLAQVQNDLFDLGAGLCRPGPAGRLDDAAIAALEAETERARAMLAPLTSFVLPGGAPAAAEAHRARTVARRAERRVWALGPGTGVDPVACRYLNRLSDTLFVLARCLNDDGRSDIAWVPRPRPSSS